LSFAATTLLSIKGMVEGQAAMAICGETLEVYRSKTVSGIVTETTAALAVAAGHQAPQVVNGIVSCLEAVSNGTPIYVISSREMPVNLSDGIQIDVSDDERNHHDSELGREESREEVHDDAHQINYINRRLRAGLSMVRWLNVHSHGFEEIFSFDRQTRRILPVAQPGFDEQEDGVERTKDRSSNGKSLPPGLADVSQKWIDHAQR